MHDDDSDGDDGPPLMAPPDRSSSAVATSAGLKNEAISYYREIYLQNARAQTNNELTNMTRVVRTMVENASEQQKEVADVVRHLHSDYDDFTVATSRNMPQLNNALNTMLFSRAAPVFNCM